MADQSGGGITWTDETWNPIRGCSVVSAGCKNCYAMVTAANRLSKPGQPYHGLAIVEDGVPKWTGKVAFVEEKLFDPLRWTRPRRIFVNSMSDLFHEELTWGEIARVFAVMAVAKQHTFQVLTKRATGMLDALTTSSFITAVADSIKCLPPRFRPPKGWDFVWPLPNVWLGVSVESARYAHERIPALLAAPAAVRWLSLEPLLGRVDMDAAARIARPLGPGLGSKGLDWLVVGGESGANARPMHPEWARALRNWAVRKGVPFHFKQWGEWQEKRQPVGGGTRWGTLDISGDFYETATPWNGRTGNDSEAGEVVMVRYGKRADDRKLDGREWNEEPKSAPETMARGRG